MKTGQDNGEEVETQSPRSPSVRHCAPMDQPIRKDPRWKSAACHLGVHGMLK